MTRTAPLFALLFYACAPHLVGQSTFPIRQLDLTGATRLPVEALTTAAGLTLGQEAAPTDFDQACQKLHETGLVQSCKYRYAPSPTDPKGISITLEIKEIDQLITAILDIPGFQEDELWNNLSEWNGLLQPRLPENGAASDYYLAQIEKYLADNGKPVPLAADIDGLVQQNMKLIVCPRDLATISVVAFEGIRDMSANDLTNAIRPTAIGAPYTERRMREVLRLNVKPLYERRGRLAVKFPVVRAAPTDTEGQVRVTVGLDEGLVYKLSEARVAGMPGRDVELLEIANPPTGKVANWAVVEEGLQAIEDHLKTEGRLAVRVSAARVLDNASQSASLVINVKPGPVFTFGELMFTGLDEKSQARARKRWKLETGQPLDQSYVIDYLRRLARPTSHTLKPRPGTRVVDVQIVVH